ncbi:MAG TPA: crosslink repair DNA glycosylase YcaQ family protein [bacterium]|nr:crosslink repair DNA glycosylase YcaQ family protein [bacterium]
MPFQNTNKIGGIGLIRAIGYCYAFTRGPGALPYLFEVLDTRSENRRWAWTWDWKEALPTEKRVFYGRVIAGKPAFVSMAFLPHFFALSGNVGDPDDYRRLYDEGRLAALGRRVYELVAARGPLTTREIRAAVEPQRRGSSGRLLRALAEVQNRFLLARIAEVGDNPGNYAYVWDLFDRWLPEIVARAGGISQPRAAAALLAQYARIAGAPRPQEAAALFDWPPSLLATALADVRRGGEIRLVRGPEGEDRLVAASRLRRLRTIARA